MRYVYSLDLGAVAQLGERGVRNAKVRGSIPLSSISALCINRHHFLQVGAFLMPGSPAITFCAPA